MPLLARCLSENHLPVGSAAASASSSSPSCLEEWERFFFFGLSPLNLSFLDTTPEDMVDVEELDEQVAITTVIRGFD